MNAKKITTGLAAVIALVSLGAAAQNSATEVSAKIIPITYYLLDDGAQINTNNAPTINWVAPNQNQEYTFGDTISVEATASDVDGVVVKVDLRVGGEVVGSDSIPPYSWDSLTYSALSQLPAGTHFLDVVATDNYGKTSAVATRDILINALNVLPEISFSLPAVNSVVEGTAVQVEVNASDADGLIASVQLLVDGTAFRTELNAPYNWNTPVNPGDDALVLSTLSVGNHELSVIVTDNAGGQQTATQTITITPVFVDRDGDGVADRDDAFPNDATETEDSDGVGDNADDFPNDPTRSKNVTTIQLDFGRSETVANWNVINGNTYTLNSLVNNEGEATDIGYAQIERLGGYGAVGTTSSVLGYPAAVTVDVSFNRTTQRPQGAFRLTGLEADQSYTVSFFASHLSANENRQTTYTVAGNSEQSASLNPSQNVDEEVSVTVQPNSEGELIVTVSEGPENEDGRYYLGAVRISTADTTPPVDGITECNDGIDNDDDGLTDWQHDIGCWGAEDNTETAGTREQENGWTTFDKSDDSIIYYVSSSDGNDANDGSSPEEALATPSVAWSKLRDDHADIILFKRGDTWRDEYLVSYFHSSYADIRKSGRSEAEKIVVSTYGDSTQRPIFEITEDFISQDKGSSNIAYVGLSFISYKKDINDSEFDGKTGGGIRFAQWVDPSNSKISNILIEDVSFKYGELTVLSVDNIEVRRNTFHKSYSVGTCFIRKDNNGNVVRDENDNLIQSKQGGNNAPRPSGMYVGSDTNGILIEDNIFDHNGWNTEEVPFEPDNLLVVNDPEKDPAGVMGACATDRNHNVYLSGVKNAELRNNIFTRASFASIKVSGYDAGVKGVENVTIEDNLFSEGALAINMAGNGNVAAIHRNSTIRNNVFTDIGRSRPVVDNLSWGIWFNGHEQTLVDDNLFVNPPVFPLDSTSVQVHAFLFEGSPYNSNISIEDNTVHGYSHAVNLIYIDTEDNQTERNNILFKSNTLHSDQYSSRSDSSLLIRHDGPSSGVNYSANRYYSLGLEDSESDWFLYGGSGNVLNFNEWQSQTGELDASISTYSPVDPGRNVDSYATTLGVGNTLKEFAEEAIKQSRFNWRSEYEAKAVSAYIREGYVDSNN